MSSDAIEDAARATSDVYECLFEDSSRLQGVVYASKHVVMRFVGSTNNFVRPHSSDALFFMTS